MSTAGVSRRRTLTGVASAALALPILAACGDGDTAGTTATDPASSATKGQAPPTSTPTEAESTEATPGGPVATTGDVPVGGGLVVGESGVVITQPTEGDFKGFSSICTHQGCTVREVTATIDCVCHGSSFAIDTGAPVSGLATVPLGEVPLTIDGDQITLA